MKKPWARFVCFYPILLALLTGCGSVSKPMESWMGRHVNELTADWGMPQQIMHDEDGFIYVYDRSKETVRFKEKSSLEKREIDPLPTAPSDQEPLQAPEGIPAETKTYPKRSMLWINKEGVIYKWAWGTW